MTEKSSIMDYAYEIAKKDHNKDFTFSFHTLWKSVCAKSGLDKVKEAYDIGEFLGDLMQDVRFVRVSDDQWKLRENMKYDEWDKISKRMFGTKEYLEEGYEDFYDKENEEEMQKSDEDLSEMTSDMDENESTDDFNIDSSESKSETILTDEILDTQEEDEE